jgi:hypothetical protein
LSGVQARPDEFATCENTRIEIARVPNFLSDRARMEICFGRNRGAASKQDQSAFG